MRPLAIVRRALARHRSWRAALLACLAVTAALIAVRSIDGLAAEQRAWGDTAPTAVAIRPITRGSVISDADVVVHSWPVRLRPTGALDRAPVGRVAWQHVGAGEVLGPHDVEPPAGPLAALAPGTAAVSIPAGLVPLRPGDVVLVVIDGREGAEGIVLELSSIDLVGQVALVAVDASVAPSVAGAASEGRVSLALSASPRPAPAG